MSTRRILQKTQSNISDLGGFSGKLYFFPVCFRYGPYGQSREFSSEVK